MERCSKRGFFDGHKRKNMIEYQRIFLGEMKALLSYFDKFKENSTILPKKYLDNCAVKGID